MSPPVAAWRLFLPEDWAADEGRRRKAYVPEETPPVTTIGSEGVSTYFRNCDGCAARLDVSVSADLLAVRSATAGEAEPLLKRTCSRPEPATAPARRARLRHHRAPNTSPLRSGQRGLSTDAMGGHRDRRPDEIKRHYFGYAHADRWLAGDHSPRRSLGLESPTGRPTPVHAQRRLQSRFISACLPQNKLYSTPSRASSNVRRVLWGHCRSGSRLLMRRLARAPGIVARSAPCSGISQLSLCDRWLRSVARRVRRRLPRPAGVRKTRCSSRAGVAAR